MLPGGNGQYAQLYHFMVRHGAALIAEPPGEWSPALPERVLGPGPLLCDRIGSKVLDKLETFLQDEALLQKAADLSNGSVCDRSNIQRRLPLNNSNCSKVHLGAP